MTLAPVVLAFVTAQRLGELVLARRNTLRLLAQGAVEIAPGHYPLIVTLHGAWLAGLWLFAWKAAPSLPLLGVYGALQGLRLWTLAALGRSWTTRIIVRPGSALVRHGPYRLVRHPNYAVVVGEIAVLPLAFGLGWYALVFSVLNAIVLSIRVRAENTALAPLKGDSIL